MNKPSARVAALLEKTRSNRGRLVFACDATMSRQPTWDLAVQLQSVMFREAAKIGGLDIQLVWYRGVDEVGHTPWLSDVHELVSRMSMIKCDAGTTKIARVLRHVRAEHERETIGAAIFVGDAVEEAVGELYDAAVGQPPWFLFQEGDLPTVAVDRFGVPVSTTQTVESVFRKVAQTTGGAWARFDAHAAGQARRAAAGRRRLRRRRYEGARRSAYRWRAKAAQADEMSDVWPVYVRTC